MKKYKCEDCDTIFESDKEDYNVCCPNCFGYEVYEMNEAGRKQALKNATDYENAIGSDS